MRPGPGSLYMGKLVSARSHCANSTYREPVLEAAVVVGPEALATPVEGAVVVVGPEVAPGARAFHAHVRDARARACARARASARAWAYDLRVSFLVRVP